MPPIFKIYSENYKNPEITKFLNTSIMILRLGFRDFSIYLIFEFYSWSPYLQCNGTAKPINDFFGGKPGDRNYDLVDGEKSTTHYGFNGCPAVINSKII